MVVIALMVTGDNGLADPFDALGDTLVAVGVVQWSLLTLSLLLSIRSPGWWMFAGPAAATVGIMLIGGLTLSALMLVVDVDALPAGPALMLFDVFGLAVGAGILVTVAFAVRRLVFRGGHGGEAPSEAFLRSGEARRRARLARLTADVGAIATGVGMTFLVAGGVVFVTRYQSDDRDLWRLTPNPLVDLGRASLLVVLTFMVLNVIKARANPESLRRIGTVWDVLTFWPRTFHPFAIRPYSERAVPELRHLLAREGWSNGAAGDGPQPRLGARVRRAAPPRQRRRSTAGTSASSPLPANVGLVTFGSPLRTLYARAFPHYVDPAELRPDPTAPGRSMGQRVPLHRSRRARRVRRRRRRARSERRRPRRPGSRWWRCRRSQRLLVDVGRTWRGRRMVRSPTMTPMSSNCASPSACVAG